MSDEIMLAKSFDMTKLDFPVEVSIKLDGVAADFYKTEKGWLCQSRQGKPLPSTEYIIQLLNARLSDVRNGTHIVGELTVMGVDTFKDAAGIIRRHEADKRIVLNVYDAYVVGSENLQYEDRLLTVEKLVNAARIGGAYTDGSLNWFLVNRVPVACARAIDANNLQIHLNSVYRLMEQSDMNEGFMIRPLRGPHSRYKIGKRSWGMQKYKPKPSVDLVVHSFEEATANKDMVFLKENFSKGQGLGAVGRINVHYKGRIEGAGPGTLKHADRRRLWNLYTAYGGGDITELNFIAEIEHMLDKNYEGLRQPVFKRWRTDKEFPNEEL